MKRVIGIALVSLAIIGAVYLCWPKKADCVWCYTGQCLNSSICGSGCVCMKENNSMWGSCVSFK